MKKHLFIFLFLAGFLTKTPAQTLSTISSRWSDSFVEWELYAIFPIEKDTTAVQDSLEMAEIEKENEEYEPEEELYGTLQLRWLNVKDDFSEWDFELGDLRGTIKQRWKNDPEQWELRTYDGEVVTMRTAWPRDLSEWRVTNNSTTLNFKSRWTNQLDEWIADDKNFGTFYLHTLRMRDPRDWTIQDKFSSEIPETMKLAMIFLAVFHASPRQ